jgi:hypothetical protein
MMLINKAAEERGCNYEPFFCDKCGRNDLCFGNNTINDDGTIVVLMAASWKILFINLLAIQDMWILLC